MPISLILWENSTARRFGRSASRAGEQQRLALLMRPNWLFLDESTSAVDEEMEAELYAVFAGRLKGTTIVSIGHRSAIVALHQRHLEMTPETGHFTLRDVPKVVAAERGMLANLRVNRRVVDELRVIPTSECDIWDTSWIEAFSEKTCQTNDHLWRQSIAH